MTKRGRVLALEAVGIAGLVAGVGSISCANNPEEVARQVVDAIDERLGRNSQFDEAVRGS